MMFHWSVLIFVAWLAFVVGRASKPDVTVKVTQPDPVDPFEPIDRYWLSECEPVIHRLESAAIGNGASITKTGAKELADMISDMATKLDYARHQSKKIPEFAELLKK